MSFVSSSRAGERPVEYSTIEMEQVHDTAYSHAIHNAEGQRNSSSRQSMDISDTGFDHSHASTELNTERSGDSIKKSPDGYYGPAIKDWPTGPRRPRGFSKLLLLGDLLLILLPIAFLGKCGVSCTICQTSADLVQSLQYPPGD